MKEFKINDTFKGQLPILGEIRGKNKIISSDVYCCEKLKNYYLIECECGNQRFIRIDLWRSNQSLQCKNCRNIQNYINNVNLNLLHKRGFSPKHRGYKELPLSFFNTYKYRAKSRGLEFKISIEYAYSIFENQRRRCALSGLPITLPHENLPVTNIINGHRNIDFSRFNASIDRIDSSKGYIEGNIQWVHRDINKMKMDFTQDHFCKLCTLINNYVNQKPSYTNMHNSSIEGSETTEMNSINNNFPHENPIP